MKRIGLFILTNILVVLTISILLRILGVDRYMNASGIDYRSLLIMAFVWGMTGSIISLLLSRVMAKWMMGVQVIDAQRPGEFGWLVDMVHQISRGAGLSTMPEVGIYPSPELNAFATGPTKNRSLVAFSSGILDRMDRSALAGVVGHELAHIKNGDMVTMTLLQGVVNAFAYFFARVVAFFLSQSSRSEENRGYPNPFLVFFLELAFTILGSIVVCWFSRQREYRADRGGATYAGRENMIGGLETLRRYYGRLIAENESPVVQTLKISGRTSAFGRLFMTHPPLEERIERLKNFGSGGGVTSMRSAA